MSAAKYSFLPHTTDAYIQAEGTSLEEALESAGKAMFDTLCDVNSVEAKLHEQIKVEGHDEIELIYNWLEALLLKFELEQKVYSSFQVNCLKESSSGLSATANIFGEPYDKRRHGAKVEVKGVTYHKMEVSRDGGRTTLRFVLDL